MAIFHLRNEVEEGKGGHHKTLGRNKLLAMLSGRGTPSQGSQLRCSWQHHETCSHTEVSMALH